MKNIKKLFIVIALVLTIGSVCTPVFAEGNEPTSAVVADSTGDKAKSASFAVGIAAAAAAIGMGIAIAKSAESISRQPEAEGSIRTALMLGLVFIETVVIYALIVAILVIFVL